MVDIHSHILYGLDDGAKTLEESVAMVRMAAESGTTDIVATPHANLHYRFDPNLIRERAQELEHATGEKLRVYTGCDFHLSFDNIQDAIAHPAKYTINQKCYLLVEFSELLIFKNSAEIFGRLLDAGMIPVVTHPERNQLLQQRLEEIEVWVAEGVLIQVTAQSVTGDFGRGARDFSAKLFDRGLVHFVASDAHDCMRRPPKLDKARKRVEERWGAGIARKVFSENPQAVLEGRSLSAESAAIAPSRRKWYRWW